MELGPDDQIDHIAYEAPYRQLAAILTARIKRGDWKPGKPLPSEVRLAEEYGISRGTVRHALTVLVADDLVQTAPQRGTFVKRK
ncbi:GntR family transcriptional regulator [Actinopolymorpha pittospori]|uniref:DNA-binding GntR family transcriptional regulator n=1 Tax=Actinopolymorpha pittospori TaxID=648752 RepID=A0A927MSW6_9ACTN|nr:winged helix-turn-helix domain-containing protein [Actinopolymorpha pittospori]MBE1605564.1 DNA-binding GntR family transcriptional regulator [Actinopolymorpha pittospori]